MSTASGRMARVRRQGTAPEWKLRRALWRRGLRYRLHARDLPGTPDVVFRTARVAVFLHGCFWHRHAGCRRTSTPKTNVAFWTAKFAANVQRDARNLADLCATGWTPYVVWECETATPHALDSVVN
ncbi:MAG: very short patch repair endonuclease [Trueperaceae bacterium]|nr:very short patch repair endonuclease [Trueperaceae bacterium]